VCVFFVFFCGLLSILVVSLPFPYILSLLAVFSSLVIRVTSLELSRFSGYLSRSISGPHRSRVELLSPHLLPLAVLQF